jgi:hypothetical protein
MGSDDPPASRKTRPSLALSQQEIISLLKHRIRHRAIVPDGRNGNPDEAPGGTARPLGSTIPRDLGMSEKVFAMTEPHGMRRFPEALVKSGDVIGVDRGIVPVEGGTDFSNDFRLIDLIGHEVAPAPSQSGQE